MLSRASQNLSQSILQIGRVASALLIVAASPAFAQTKLVAGVPGATAHANNRGPIDPTTPLKLTVWLEMHNKAEFDHRVEALYTKGSPTYHHWLSSEDLVSYAPSNAELLTVKQQLEKSGLSVNIDEANPFVLRASGPASKVQAAFGVEIDTFEKNGETFRANITEAHLTGTAGELVRNVGGLHNIRMKPLLMQPKNARTGKPLASVPLAKVMASGIGLSAFFTNHCFETPATFTFGTPGKLPVGVYFGNVYGASGLTCAYTPAQMQAAYGLPAVYKAGYAGQGQTILLLEGYGSPTIVNDANYFSALTGLPSLTAANFKTVFPDGKPLDPALGVEWLREISLDVEWTHAIAPQAKIVLLAAPSGDDQDLQYVIQYAALHKMGNVLSGSFGTPEVELGPQDLDGYNQVIEQAAAVGIAVNFASGDYGDLGLGTPMGAIDTPSDSPWATAVGGTSIGIPGGTDSAHEVGWGNNQTYVSYNETQDQAPPYNYGSVAGAGGGSSLFFAKPAWQKALPGNYRLDPDVALDADPYTGVPVIYTYPNFGQTIEAVGGTSLSAPMFSAFWALANQKAGHSLGQAAPILSRLPTSALRDIVPINSSTDVVGTIVASTGATFYSAADLAQPLEGTSEFVSAIWPINGEYINLTFGTDCSLKTSKGWDNVTGYGTPNGLYFINAAAKE